MLVYQVPLKFRYPFLAQIMWYAADKYVRLLERNIKELGLNPTPKAEQNKQNTATGKKKDAGVTPKRKHANKRSARSDVHEDNEKTGASTQEENKDDDTTDTPGRRRSSRVARNEAIARQAQDNTEKGGAVKSGNKGKEEKTDTEELGRKKGTPKKHSKGNETKVEVNGENHVEEGDNDKAVNSSETNKEEEDKTPWRAVYLTRFEVDGLTALIARLREWPQAKKNVPAEVEDPDGLLERLEVCANLIQSYT